MFDIWHTRCCSNIIQLAVRSENQMLQCFLEKRTRPIEVDCFLNHISKLQEEITISLIEVWLSFAIVLKGSKNDQI